VVFHRGSDVYFRCNPDGGIAFDAGIVIIAHDLRMADQELPELILPYMMLLLPGRYGMWHAVGTYDGFVLLFRSLPGDPPILSYR
jgi:hypothetical protein